MAGLLQKSGKSPEKCSNFAQTCNRLSQYLKKGGSFGDIGLGINGFLEAKGSETIRQPATTMKLFPNGENSSDALGKAGAFPYSKSLDVLPQFAAFGSANFNGEITGKADLRKSPPTEPGTAQMTIFYGGQVIVFDGFPAEKAKEIMDLAEKSSFSGSNGFPATSTVDKISPTNSGASESNNNVMEQLQLQPQAPASSDLPLARRASLRRFLEKRKDRVTTRAPYQINKPSHLAPSRPDESTPWINLEAQSSRHLELRL